MNLDLIGLSLALIANLSIFFILVVRRHDKVGSYFATFIFGIILWTGSVLLFSLPFMEGFKFALSNLAYLGALTAAISLLLFSFYFPHRLDNLSIKKIFIVYSFGIVAFISIFIPNFVLQGVSDVGYSLKTGPGLYLLFAIIAFHIIWALLELVNKYLKLVGLSKLQLKYLFFGLFLSALLGLFFNLILPLITHNYSFVWVGPTSSVLFIVSVYVAIVRYRLMNIRLIVTRSILYFLLVSAVTTIFIFTTKLTTETFVVTKGLNNLITFIISFFIVIFIDPLKKYLSKVTDDIFYKDRINYDLLLRNLSTIIAREIDMEVLLQRIKDTLQKELKVKNVDIVIHTDGYKIIQNQKFEDYAINDEIINLVKSADDIIVLEEYRRKVEDMSDSVAKDNVAKAIETMDSLNWQLIIPVIVESKLTAVIILDYKLSGDVYSKEDISFFNVFSPQIAIAIEKSRLYEEVENFNLELKEKIDRATKKLKSVNVDLGERNKFLTITQNISNLISRNLDINNIIQIIVDSIATELGYIGGILSFKDESGKYLYPAAITRGEAAKKGLSFLPRPTSEYRANIGKKDNFGVRCLTTGSAITSDSFADFFSPPIEKEVAGKIQQALNIVTIVGIPIYSENKIIGVIHYLLAVKEGSISRLDYEMMNNLADQVGIVYRNVKLYQQLENTNKKLQEANVHLKRLDQAKSEFLSIASHQLRTPTSAIKGYLSMLLEGDYGTVKPEQRKVVAVVYESAARLARLINIFLNVSRIEAGRFKLNKAPTDMNEIIKGVVIELQQQAKTKDLELKVNLPTKAPILNVDSDKIREVVLNLVDNSIKYTQKGFVEINSRVKGDRYEFWTRDSGMGIRTDEVNSLFKKFVRGTGVAQVNTGGSGLGLYIAQRVIKEHGGHIWAESDGLDKGSIFKFTLAMDKSPDITSQHLK